MCLQSLHTGKGFGPATRLSQELAHDTTRHPSRVRIANTGRPQANSFTTRIEQADLPYTGRIPIPWRSGIYPRTWA